MARVRRETDRLVDCIESRLERGGDGPSVRQRLASGIYDVRRGMEQLEVWFQHYHDAGADRG